MRIALLTPTYAPFSGIDRMVEQHAKKYIKLGWQVTIITLSTTIMVLSTETLSSPEITIVNIGMPKSPLMQRIYRLLFFLDKAKINKYGTMLKDYDYIVSYFYPMDLIAINAKHKNPLVSYLYCDPGVAGPETFSSFIEKTYMRVFRWLSNRTSKQADGIIHISKYLAEEYYKQNGRKGEVRYIEIDRERFNKNVKKGNIRKKYNIPKNALVCLYVGRISPHKGIDLLIHAFNIANMKLDLSYYDKTSYLIIVGKKTFDGYYKKLESIPKQNVIFTGFVDDKDLPAYYAECDIYTTATLWEGFDLPIKEANACGKPAVAFDIGPHKEILKQGQLVPERDIQAFANAIIKIWKTKCK